MCRWGYAFERTSGNCLSEADWTDSTKDKLQWEMMSGWHPSEKEIEAMRSESAEGEVTNNLKNKAPVQRYLSKVKKDP